MNQTPNTPMPSVVANFTVCSSCNTEQPPPYLVDGTWRRDFQHDPSCPTLTGAVDPGWDLFRASRGGREAGQ